MELNQLNIAAGKCVVLQIGRNNQRRGYTCGGLQLKSVETVKDLGLLLADDLKPSKHCAAVSAKAFNKSSLLFRGFSCRDPAFLKAAFCVCQAYFEVCFLCLESYSC